ncbi:SH3 domain-containing protein [Butyrivibrio sp. XPD2006]|uniref:SH3 domain-containing protein n=1 Tax=Butyrivibrio sp. XPD2006 TaxID=1280668 RepID=UPI0003B6F961|nr:SH3 domain-containing protein [Butyrivibrio sp. XPD2006]
MRKKKNNVTNWRNEKKDIFAILGDNKKYLMPAILVVAVVLTVVIAVSANHRATEIAASTATEAESTVFEVPDVAMEENTSPEVNALVEKYYTASANGDADTLAAIYKGLDETEILKAVAASEYIDTIDNIKVYTKPGPVEGSYVAYVYNEVKLYDYEGRVPGLEILYICSDGNGDLYINGDVVDAGELDYLKQINVQADVIDLNNKVASSYNEMVSGDEALAELLTRMRSGLQVSVGEALATSEASTPEESAAEASSEEEETVSDTVTVTTRTIKATDVINIRSSDSETADILDKTTQGQEFKELEALANGWSKVEYKGKEAYVKTEFFEVVSEETTVVDNGDEGDTNGEDESASAASSASTQESSAASSASTETQTKVSSSKTGKMTLTDSVKFRKGQSTDSEAITTIYAGSTVNVIEQYASGWAKIEYNNKTGYVKSEFLQD